MLQIPTCICSLILSDFSHRCLQGILALPYSVIHWFCFVSEFECYLNVFVASFFWYLLHEFSCCLFPWVLISFVSKLEYYLNVFVASCFWYYSVRCYWCHQWCLALPYFQLFAGFVLYVNLNTPSFFWYLLHEFSWVELVF